MSFYSTAYFYRPSRPPTITGKTLAEFCRRFVDLNVATMEFRQTLQIKFGKHIDDDNRPSPSIIVFEDEYEPSDAEWDIDVQYESFAEMSKVLSSSDMVVYRAFIELGMAPAGVRDEISRNNSSENEIDLTLGDWSLQIGPISIADMASEPVQVGWIALAISGPGYLFPWQPADLVARLEKNALIMTATELCKTMWPVQPDPPVERQDDSRRQSRSLRPNDALDRPSDWYWGVSESG
jgi:hypothetical protein